MILPWNYDKPHRCPRCHAIWVYGTKYSPPGQGYKGEYLTPRWWKTYTCDSCGAVFSGRRAVGHRFRDRAMGRINYWRREWRRKGHK